MEYEKMIKKPKRLKLAEKKRFSDSSGTLSGQVARGQVNRGYAGKKKKTVVTVKI